MSQRKHTAGRHTTGQRPAGCRAPHDLIKSGLHTAGLRPVVLHPRLILLLVFVAAFAFAVAGLADVVDTIDRGKLGGNLTMSAGDTALTLTDKQGKTSTINLIDIDQVRFNVEMQPKQVKQQLLVNNEPGNGQRQRSGKAKLLAGLHRITIPYWQAAGGHRLSVYVSGPGLNGRVELGSEQLRCFRNNGDGAKPSQGLDEKGYRLPELDLETASDRRRMLTRARYRLYTGSADNVPTGVRSLASLELRRSGTTSAMNTGMLNEHNNNVGLVFDAFFIAKQDGEYTFTLLSDDGSQLYLGQVEDFSSDRLGEPPVNAPWHAELAHDGQAMGELKSIADEAMTFHLPLVSDVTLALGHTKAVWFRKADRAAINRDNEPENEDTVYLKDKKDPEIIRSVSGKVSGLDDGNLTFVFRGKERTIARDRVVGLVFKHASRAAPTPPRMHQVLELQGGQVLPCMVKTIGEHVTFEIIGGSLATPPRSVVRAMRVENGRRIDLTRLAPNAEESIPYFSLKLPYKVNTNFSGRPIVLFDEKIYERGLAVHSKSRLHYKLKPNCERFLATFGLMHPGGKLGNVTARVLGDGKVLWQQDNITATTNPIEIDVELKGVERLILEVDFGEGQNVGDRAAWCNPRLIYASSAEEKP